MEKVKKIKAVYDHLKSKFQEVFYPYKNVVIDESLILWRGTISFRQYMHSQRHRVGLKLFCICDCKTGIVQDILIYTGKDTEVTGDRSLGMSGAIVPSWSHIWTKIMYCLWITGIHHLNCSSFSSQGRQEPEEL